MQNNGTPGAPFSSLPVSLTSPLPTAEICQRGQMNGARKDGRRMTCTTWKPYFS